MGEKIAISIKIRFFYKSTFNNVSTTYEHFIDRYISIFVQESFFLVRLAAAYITPMDQLMQKHKGKIVESAIKEAGYQMKAVAQGLGIARNTLYTRLKEAELEDDFIINVSKIIHYDFSKVFPEVYQRFSAKIENNPSYLYLDKSEKSNSSNGLPYYNTEYKNPYFLQLQALNAKYLKLMEDYHKLLKILILFANNNELVGIKKEIMEFLEDEGKND